MPIPALAHTATSLTMPDAMLSFGLYRVALSQAKRKIVLDRFVGVSRTQKTVVPTIPGTDQHTDDPKRAGLLVTSACSWGLASQPSSAFAVVCFAGVH